LCPEGNINISKNVEKEGMIVLEKLQKAKKTKITSVKSPKSTMNKNSIVDKASTFGQKVVRTS
jgi:hypothetical protein